MGPGAEAPGSVSTAALPQDAYAARRASMTTLSLAFRVLVRCPEQGLPAPNRSSPYRRSHLILPKQGRTRGPFTVQSNLTSPPAETPWPQSTPVKGRLRCPVKITGQDVFGGGAGYRPRVLKRYYEPVINLADILPRTRRKVHWFVAASRTALPSCGGRRPGRAARCRRRSLAPAGFGRYGLTRHR